MNNFKNRVEMLSVVPKNGIACELGVYAGDFSEAILKETKPKELILIDRYNDSKIECGDANGENIQYKNGIELYQSVCKRFVNNSGVRIFRSNTSFIANFANDYFDLIYVDADHSLKGCYADLVNSFTKIKNGGFIMCHDYNSKGVGVKDAVDNFCIEYKQTIEYTAFDKSITVGLKITK